MKGSHHVGNDELLRAVDRTIDMRLRREVHHHIDVVFFQQLGNQSAVTDVADNQRMARIQPDRIKVRRIAGISELVECHDLFDRHSKLIRSIA